MPESQAAPPPNALSLRALPIYSTFFLWGFGTGAQQLARPLFAASFGVPLSLVTLIAANNSLAALVTAPTTGFLTDRFGRKPLVIVGNLLRGATTVAQFFAQNYWQFFVMEFIGAIGVSMWATGSSIVMADITERANRGRASAVRGMTMRLGTAAGFSTGGILFRTMGLRSVFLFNGLTKIPIHLIMWFLVRETRPARQPSLSLQGESRSEPSLSLEGQGQGEGRPLAGVTTVDNVQPKTAEDPQDRIQWSIFLTRAILVLCFATLVYSLAGTQGILGTLFPVWVSQIQGMDAGDAGQFLGLAAIIGLAISYPNGVLVDRYGRKKSLIPGLMLLGLSAFLLSRAGDYLGVLEMIVVYGLGDGICLGAFEVYAMDLAPIQARGSFLGVWALLRNVGGILAPAALGLTAQAAGMPAAFTMAALLLFFAALVMWAFGPETRAGRRG
jgi:MFS family permease